MWRTNNNNETNKLLNSVVHSSINTNNINDLIINLDIIEFEPLFKLYKSSLFNTELLANITVRRKRQIYC